MANEPSEEAVWMGLADHMEKHILSGLTPGGSCRGGGPPKPMVTVSAWDLKRVLGALGTVHMDPYTIAIAKRLHVIVDEAIN